VLQAHAAAAAAAGGVPVDVIDDQVERTANTTDPQSRMRRDNDSRLLLEATRSAATSVACGGALTHATGGADRLGVQRE
jgi:hypothetical protein